MRTLKNIIKKILSEQEEEQLTFDFPGQITPEKAMKSLKDNFVKKILSTGEEKHWRGMADEPWYHTGGGWGQDTPQMLISLYTKNIGSYPLMFRIDKFDPSKPINVEYRGTSKKGKMFAEILDNMDPVTFMDFINQPPFNVDFKYSTGIEDIENLERNVRPMFNTLDRWLKNTSPPRSWRGYDKFTDSNLIDKFFKEVMGIDEKLVRTKLTNWYLRSKKLSGGQSPLDVNLEKYKGEQRKFYFEIDKKQVPCDYKLSGQVIAKDIKDAERLIRVGATDKMFWIRNGKPKCLNQNTYQEGDTIRKLVPGRGEDSWSWNSIGKVK